MLGCVYNLTFDPSERGRRMGGRLLQLPGAFPSILSHSACNPRELPGLSHSEMPASQHRPTTYIYEIIQIAAAYQHLDFVRPDESLSEMRAFRKREAGISCCDFNESVALSIKRTVNLLLGLQSQ